MNDEIVLHDKTFEKYIDADKIAQQLKVMGQKISEEYENKKIYFLCILNGSFIFAADLVRSVNSKSEIHFVKLASYEGTTSTGNVSELIGLNVDLKGKHVIVIEDIVDTGKTLQKILEILKVKEVKDCKIASLLYKPSCYKGDVSINYVGFEIPDDFVVGYGLDYDNLGRTYKDLYKLKSH